MRHAPAGRFPFQLGSEEFLSNFLLSFIFETFPKGVLRYRLCDREGQVTQLADRLTNFPLATFLARREANQCQNLSRDHFFER